MNTLYGKFSLCLFLVFNLTILKAQTIEELLLLGEYEKASVLGIEKLKSDSSNIKLLTKTGLACNQADRHEEAIRYLTKAVKLDTTNYKIINRLADSYDAIGMWPKAVDWYEKVLEINTDNITALNSLGKIYFREEKYRKADFCYAVLERLFPERSIYSRKRSFCQLKSGDTLSAYPSMLLAYSKDTTDIKTISALANLQIRGGLNDEALKVLKSGLLIYPDHPRLNYLTGRVHFNKNHHYRALPFWEKLLQSEDSSYNVLMFAGRSYASTFKYKKAVELMELAYWTDSTFVPLVRALGKAHYKLKNYDKALKYTLKEGKLIFPKFLDELRYLRNLGDRYEAVGEYKEAIRIYQNIPRLQRLRGRGFIDQSYAYISIARVYDEGLKDKKKAIKYYEKYLDSQQKSRIRVAGTNELKEVEFRINFLKEQLHFERSPNDKK